MGTRIGTGLAWTYKLMVYLFLLKMWLLFALVLHGREEENACPGPFPGWLSGPPMAHNELSPLPAGRGFVLCCHGDKGAAPDSSFSYAVAGLRANPENSSNRPIVVLNSRAECPGHRAELPALPGAYMNDECEPFLKTGCTKTQNAVKNGGCSSKLGFPEIQGHEGCSSALLGTEGWVHAQCCSGEIGHTGKSVILAPGRPHLKLRVFPTMKECLASNCFTKPESSSTPCRCTFPSHVCSSKGPDYCVEFPKGFVLNRDGICGASLLEAYGSPEDCANACLLHDDCGGFLLEKTDLKTCRLFYSGECKNPTFNPHGDTHLVTYEKRVAKHTSRDDTGTEAVALLLFFYFLLVLPVFVVFIAAYCM